MGEGEPGQVAQQFHANHGVIRIKESEQVVVEIRILRLRERYEANGLSDGSGGLIRTVEKSQDCLLDFFRIGTLGNVSNWICVK